MSKLYLYKTKTGYRWRLTGKNHRIVAASSEAFSSARKARQNIILTQKTLGDIIIQEAGTVVEAL